MDQSRSVGVQLKESHAAEGEQAWMERDCEFGFQVALHPGDLSPPDKLRTTLTGLSACQRDQSQSSYLSKKVMVAWQLKPSLLQSCIYRSAPLENITKLLIYVLLF